MEQFVYNANSFLKSITQNNFKVNNEAQLGTCSMLQALGIASFEEILTNIISDDSNTTANKEQSLLSQLVSVLYTADESNNNLINWFNELSKEEQIMIYEILTNLYFPTNEISIQNLQKMLKDMSQNVQHDNNRFTRAENYHLTGIQKEVKEINVLIDSKNIEIKRLLEYAYKELSNNNIIENNIQFEATRDKESSIFVDNRTINLISSFAVNSIHSFKKNGASEMNPQENELKILDLNHMQSTNNFNINTKVDRKTDNPINQSLQNLIVNEGFVNELGKIIIKSLKLPNGNTETKIQLQPSELGKVNVKLSAVNGQISAQIVADSVMGKELLESQIHQLRFSLTSLGYQVDKIEVQQSASSVNIQNDGNGFESTKQQPFQQQQHQKEHTINYIDNILKEEEEIDNYLYSVSGIDYTA